jgi:ATP-dependent Clp protease ATP-binding subunit ClpC
MAETSILDYREPEWVAEKLGLDKNTVYKYLQEGWLPGVQLGRKWLISERLLAEHLERETRSQTAIRRKEVVPNTDLPFTPRFSRAIRLAGDYAMSRGQEFTGTEHLLIGMVQEGENVGVMVLRNLGIRDAKPREIFEALVPAQGHPKKLRDVPRTDRSNNVLRLAREQALAIGHQYVGCETLLLGILLEPAGMGCEILQSLGVTYEAARAEVLKLVHGRA